VDVTTQSGDTNQTIVATASDLYIGSDTYGYFKGSLDELAIYPAALSAARVQAHYDAGRG
jgi:hypothetical protein